MANKKEKKVEVEVEEEIEIEWFSLTCLLENFSRALIEIPEGNYDEAYEKLTQSIKSEEFFDAEEFGGSIEVSGVFVNSLNCKKVLGFIY